MLRDDGRDGWFWVKEGEERIYTGVRLNLGILAAAFSHC